MAKRSLIELESERWQWSQRMFPEATAQSSLEKLKEEIKEIEKENARGFPDILEYVDALMCLLDSAERSGITPQMILAGFETKNKINFSRTWIKNPDNSYSHVKDVPNLEPIK